MGGAGGNPPPRLAKRRRQMTVYRRTYAMYVCTHDQLEKTMRERMLAGSPVHRGRPRPGPGGRAGSAARPTGSTRWTRTTRGRRALLEELLGAFGEGSEILPPLRCDYGYQTPSGRGSSRTSAVPLDVARDDRRRRPDGPERPAAHPRPIRSSRGRGGTKWEAALAHHHRRQRVARRRRHRVPGRDHRGEHGRRRGLGRRPGPAGKRRRRRLTGEGRP